METVYATTPRPSSATRDSPLPAFGILLDSNVVDSAKKAHRLLDEIGSPFLKVTFDAANPFHAGGAKRRYPAAWPSCAKTSPVSPHHRPGDETPA
jgi:hypothetical protein